MTGYDFFLFIQALSYFPRTLQTGPAQPYKRHLHHSFNKSERNIPSSIRKTCLNWIEEEPEKRETETTRSADEPKRDEQRKRIPIRDGNPSRDRVTWRELGVCKRVEMTDRVTSSRPVSIQIPSAWIVVGRVRRQVDVYRVDRNH